MSDKPKGVSISFKPIIKPGGGVKPLVTANLFQTSSKDEKDFDTNNNKEETPTLAQGEKAVSGQDDSYANNSSSWLQPGLLIKVKNNVLANGSYFGKTGIVRRIIDKFGGEVHVEGGDILQLDQDDCSTVLPALGELGLIVFGPYKDSLVRVIRREDESKDIEVELEEGPRIGHRLLLPRFQICRHIAIDRQ